MAASTSSRATLFYVRDAGPTRNITLALPEDDLRRARVLAARRGTSISRLLTGMLEELLEQDSGYAFSRQRSVAALARGHDLGTRGERRWTRGELHER